MSAGVVAPFRIRKRRSALVSSGCTILRTESATFGRAFDTEMVTASTPILSFAHTSARTCGGNVAEAMAKTVLVGTRPRSTPNSAYSERKLPPHRLTQ